MARERARPTVVRTKSIDRFKRRDDRESRRGGRLTRGTPSIDVNALRPGRPTRRAAERCRSGRRDPSGFGPVRECFSCDSLEKATMTRSTSSSRTIAGSRSVAAKQRKMRQVVASLFRLSIDEADEVDAVLRMLKKLLRDQLTDIAGPDDHRVLQIRDVTTRARPGDRAPTGDERHCSRPEDQELRGSWMRQPRDVRAGEEQPRADRDHVEDAGEVVRCRVVRALLVMVVEPVELRDHDPAGQRGEEDDDLAASVEDTEAACADSRATRQAAWRARAR